MVDQKYSKLHAESAILQDKFQAEKDPVLKNEILSDILKSVKISLYSGVRLGSQKNYPDFQDDMHQAANMDLMRGIRNETGKGSLHAYAFRIGLRCGANYSRRHSHRRRFDTPYEQWHDDVQSIEFKDPIEENDTRVSCDRAVELLKTLPELQREVLKMVFLEGKTLKTCAEVLSLTVPNTHKVKNKGLKELQRLMLEEENKI